MGTVAARPGTAPLVCRHDLRGGHRPHCHELAEVQTYCCAMPFRGHDVHRDGFAAPWLSRSRRDDPGGVRPVGVRVLQVRLVQVPGGHLRAVLRLHAPRDERVPAAEGPACGDGVRVLHAVQRADVRGVRGVRYGVQHHHRGPGVSGVQARDGPKAALAFSFLTWAATCVSMLFTFKEWRDAGYESMPGIPFNFDYMPGRGNAATTQTFA